MSFDFPSSGLTVGEIITGPNNIQYRWDGTKWVSVTTATGSYLPTTGGNLSGPGNLGVGGNLTVTGTTALDGTTATTPAPGDNSTNVATTAFVDAAIAAAPSGGVTISDTAPANPSAGELWFDSVGLQTYIWYDDPTSSQWTTVTNQGGLLSDAPSNGTIYGRQNGAWSAVSGIYLPLAGGTLTGALNITPGAVTNALVVASTATWNTVQLNNSGSGRVNAIEGLTNGSLRWRIRLGNGTPESGSNAGSDFQLDAYSDTGVSLNTWFAVSRSNGNTSIGGYLSVNNSMQISGATSTSRNYNYFTAGNQRWATIANATPESGSNAGSDWGLLNYADNGGYIGVVMQATRSSAVVTFTNPIVNGSDLRQKRDVTPINDALDLIKQLAGVSYERIKRPGKRELGLIAQDVRTIVPEAIEEIIEPPVEGATYVGTPEEPMLGISYSQLTPLLIEAVKMLAAKVEALEAAHGV